MDRKVGDPTPYWLFLIGLTTGARLEEVGQAALADIKASGDATYIDIDDYVLDPADDERNRSRPTARAGWCRSTITYSRLASAHTATLVAAGHTRPFPDLIANQFDKRTKQASRVANRYIDATVSADARLTFHSLRHGFKDLALEAGITERIVDQICGHAPTTVGGKYGQG